MQARPFDSEYFLQSGELTKPFISAQFVYDKVMGDYNKNITNGIRLTKLDSLMNFIHSYVKQDNDSDFISENKYYRTAKEVFESGKSTGTTDFANLFCTFARQLGLPTTHLHAADYTWVKQLKAGKLTRHVSCSFCECYYGGKWLLIDPANKKIINDYNPSMISLGYYIGTSCQYVAYMRCIDLGKQHVEEHNKKMEKICFSI